MRLTKTRIRAWLPLGDPLREAWEDHWRREREMKAVGLLRSRMPFGRACKLLAAALGRSS